MSHHARPVLIAEARRPVAVASVVVALIVAPVHDRKIRCRITLPRFCRQLWQLRDDTADIIDLMQHILIIVFREQVVENRTGHDADMIFLKLFAHDIDIKWQIAVRPKLNGLIACLTGFIKNFLPGRQVRILDIINAPAARGTCNMDCHGNSLLYFPVCIRLVCSSCLTLCCHYTWKCSEIIPPCCLSYPSNFPLLLPKLYNLVSLPYYSFILFYPKKFF